MQLTLSTDAEALALIDHWLVAADKLATRAEDAQPTSRLGRELVRLDRLRRMAAVIPDDLAVKRAERRYWQDQARQAQRDPFDRDAHLSAAGADVWERLHGADLDQAEANQTARILDWRANQDAFEQAMHDYLSQRRALLDRRAAVRQDRSFYQHQLTDAGAAFLRAAQKCVDEVGEPA